MCARAAGLRASVRVATRAMPGYVSSTNNLERGIPHTAVQHSAQQGHTANDK